MMVTVLPGTVIVVKSEKKLESAGKVFTLS